MKKINIFLISVVLLTSGCAKKVLMKYAEPEAVQECEENFYGTFHALIPEDEKKTLENIKTLLECEEFIEQFWQKRDTDPSTPENEFKTEKEKLVSNIKNEVLFNGIGTTGFMFKNNGDFKGDAAKVYILHGPPDYAEISEHGINYENLMLWIYLGERGEHKYRFLFYHKNGFGNFVLLRPNFYLEYGLQQINKNPAFTHPLEVYNELERNGKSIFLYSMVNFSDTGISLDEAMRPPKPASEIAKTLSPKIMGDIPKKEAETSSAFNSLIPAELKLDLSENKLTARISIKKEDLDWFLKDGELVSELFVRMIIWNGQETREEKYDIVVASAPVFVFESTPMELAAQRAQIGIYIHSNGKYNAWIEEISK